MVELVLLVDDEPNVLAAYRRELRDRFDLLTASSGRAALEQIDRHGTIAVVVSDMHMPEMNGIELLAEVKRRMPGAIRIMLTGCHDQNTAIAAINQGSVHRFHSKPCASSDLARSIESGIAVFRRHEEMNSGLEHFLDDCEELERALRQADVRAQSANQATSRLLAIIGHELRTPLNHVLGLSEMLRGGTIDRPKSAEYVNDIHRSAAELHRKIENALVLTQLDAGQLRPFREPLDVATVMADCAALCGDAAAEKQHSVAQNIAAELPELSCDGSLLQLALLQLLSNAIKYTPRNGRISLSAYRDAAGLVLAIEDSGIGIETDRLSQLMKPFEQASTGHARRFDGLGLGLPVAKALIELLGGCLALECAPSGGVRALLRFPARDPSAPSGHGGGTLSL